MAFIDATVGTIVYIIRVKGLQACIHTWKRLDAEINLQPNFDSLTARPALYGAEAAHCRRTNLACSDETAAELPRIFGGVTVALARAFTIIEPPLKNPQSRHYEQAMGLFSLLL